MPEQQRSDIVRQLRAWFARSRSDPPRVHRRDLGFDECGAQTRTLPARPKVMRRRRARHYKSVTLVAGLRLCGLVAQKAFDRPRKMAERTVAGLLIPLDACTR